MSKILVFEFGISCMRVFVAEKSEEISRTEELYNSVESDFAVLGAEITDVLIKADGYGYDSVYIHSWNDEKTQELSLMTAGFLTGAEQCDVISWENNGICGFLTSDFTRRRMNIPVVIK